MRSTSTTSLEPQRGFSVPAAIFIVVVLAALGAFMVTIGSSQQLGHAQDFAGSRVLQGARAGIEWGIYQVVNTTGSFRTACDSNTAPTASLTLTNMSGITVNVSCSSVAYSEGSSSLHTYKLTSTACNNTTCPNTSASNWPPMYVERQIVTSVTH